MCVKECLTVGYVPTKRCGTDPCSFIVQFNDIDSNHSGLVQIPKTKWLETENE